MTGLVFCDGFDKYGPAGNVDFAAAMTGVWTNASNAQGIYAPLSARGYSFRPASTFNSANLPGSYTRVAGSLRVNGDPNSQRFYFANNGTVAFTINIVWGTAVQLWTGVVSTLIASGGSVAPGTTHLVTWDIAVGASAAYAVYLDGALLFSGTGNTANSQPSVNQVQVNVTGGGFCYYDDLCVFDPTAPGYSNSILTAGLVVETQYPQADVARVFTADGLVVPPTGLASRGVYRTSGSTATLTANNLHLVRIIPPVNCTINNVSGYSFSASAAKMRGVVYADSAGAPAALLSSGSEVVGTSNPLNLVWPLVAPQALVAGTSYWIGVITDTGFTGSTVESASNTGIRKAATYTSGPPDPAGTGFTTAQPTYLFWANCVVPAANWASLSLNPTLDLTSIYTSGGLSQIHSSTVGQEELYTFPALTGTPAIYGAVVRGVASKSDAGPRTVSFNMRSGATDSTGSLASQVLSTSPQWMGSIFVNDPATGAAWTVTGINNATSGVSVAT